MQRFSALRAKLPGLQPLSGAGSGCEKVEGVLKEYRETVDLLVGELARGEEKKRYELRRKAAVDLDQKIKELNDFKLNPGVLNKADALPVLTKAWDLYSEYLIKAQLISGKNFGLKDEIKITTVQNLGQIEHVIPILISQLDKLSTYLIILLAVFFDALLVIFFQRHLFSRLPPDNQSPYIATQSGRAVNLLDN
jgi:hypothetical protein